MMAILYCAMITMLLTTVVVNMQRFVYQKKLQSIRLHDQKQLQSIRLQEQEQLYSIRLQQQQRPQATCVHEPEEQQEQDDYCIHEERACDLIRRIGFLTRKDFGSFTLYTFSRKAGWKDAGGDLDDDTYDSDLTQANICKACKAKAGAEDEEFVPLQTSTKDFLDSAESRDAYARRLEPRVSAGSPADRKERVKSICLRYWNN